MRNNKKKTNFFFHYKEQLENKNIIKIYNNTLFFKEYQKRSKKKL